MAARCAAVFLGLITLASLSSLLTAQADTADDARDLVIVAQGNTSIGTAGCRALSAFTVDRSEPVYRGPPAPFRSPHRVAIVGTSGFEQILAPVQLPPNGYGPHIYRLGGDTGAPGSWNHQKDITGASFMGDLALTLMPDDDTFLAITIDAAQDGGASSREAFLRKYRLSEVSRDGSLGPEHGSLKLPAVLRVDGLFPTRDGRYVHVVENQGLMVHTVDVTAMAFAGRSIVVPGQHAPVGPRYKGEKSPGRRGVALTPDGGYIVRVGWYPHTLNVIDIDNRAAWTIQGLDSPGDIDFSHGPANFGLMAIRSPDAVSVYRFAPLGPLELLGEYDVGTYHQRGGPVAWSGDGEHLIVGATHENRSEFLALTVKDGGHSLAPKRWLRACASPIGDNFSLGILTSNGMDGSRITPTPGLTPTPVPSATLLPAGRPRSLEDLAFLSSSGSSNAENSLEIPGCGAVSVFDTADGSAVHLGSQYPAPGRLAASSDFSTIVAGLGGAGWKTQRQPFLYVLRGDTADRRLWHTPGALLGGDFMPGGAVAMMPDDDTLLAATSRYLVEPYTGRVRFERPYAVRKYRLSEARTGIAPLWWNQIGPERGAFELSGLPYAIFPTSDGMFAHIVTDSGTVHTVDVRTMVEAASPIAMAPLGPGLPGDGVSHTRGDRFGYADASISADGRYILSNRAEVPEINVADLSTRQTWSVPVADADALGGVSISRGPSHRGLVAVHAATSLILFRFEPPDRLTEIGRHPISPQPWWTWGEAAAHWSSLVYPAVAWSGSGERIIAAENRMDKGSFSVFEVEPDGTGMTRRHALNPCEAYWLGNTGTTRDRSPNRVLTSNSGPAPAVPWPTLTATAPATPTPTLTVTLLPPTSTRTQLASATPSPTISVATPQPEPTPARAYIPLALRERCDTEHQRADIALVLDTSSSMTGKKLEDAKAAALLFVEMIDLEPGRSQVAVVRYDREADVVRELTRSRTLIEAAIRSLQVRSGTHIDKGLRTALEELQSPRHLDRNMPVMILLTDGLQTGTPGEELRAAAEVRDAGVRLYAIGLGSDVDEKALKTMAGDDSRYHHAPDSTDLASIYAEIAQDLTCPGKELWGGKQPGRPQRSAYGATTTPAVAVAAASIATTWLPPRESMHTTASTPAAVRPLH